MPGIKRGKNEIRQVPQNRHLKIKNQINTYQGLEFDIQDYRKKLRNETKFTIGYCKAEIKYLREFIISERYSIHDKLSVLVGFKLLHQEIIDYVYKHFIIPVSKESFPFYVLKESVSKNNKHNGQLENGIS
mmetsp:Transcript_36725/g.32948  ORF Transcript_36725/g.32948 Transcript_36725/m.32948 type:complete len:131 (-) Transcript_36725:48-440(-)